MENAREWQNAKNRKQKNIFAVRDGGEREKGHGRSAALTERIFLFYAVAVLLLTALTGILPTAGEEGIYSRAVRLHVLAQSDSEADQALKLKVRDAVLAGFDEELRSCRNREEAQACLAGQLDAVKAAADAVLEEAGVSYRAVVTLDEERYPTRNYEGFSLPAGTYLSLQVKLGEAAGKNWWCILFPPLCLSAATEPAEQQEEFLAAGFTPEEYRVITGSDGRYVLKFRILELFEAIAERWK